MIEQSYHQLCIDYNVIVVSPIVIWSPLKIFFCVIRSPFTNVPLRLFKSVNTYPLSDTFRSAWCPDIFGSSIRIAQSAVLPMEFVPGQIGAVLKDPLEGCMRTSPHGFVAGGIGTAEVAFILLALDRLRLIRSAANNIRNTNKSMITNANEKSIPPNPPPNKPVAPPNPLPPEVPGAQVSLKADSMKSNNPEKDKDKIRNNFFIISSFENFPYV